MKLIIAYIRPESLNAVKAELVKAEVGRMSVTNALGCGQQQGYTETWRGVAEEVNLLHKVRVEVAVNEAFVARTVQAITAGARSGPDGKGQIGDGKIFVVEMMDCIRIRDGITGPEAIGGDIEG
ncbi:MAG: P-II family nitrogen regulator [Bradymonadia bacterium]